MSSKEFSVFAMMVKRLIQLGDIKSLEAILDTVIDKPIDIKEEATKNNETE